MPSFAAVKCACMLNFTLGSDNKSCIPNVCIPANGGCGLNSLCSVSTAGLIVCSCNVGYVSLNNDGRSCIANNCSKSICPGNSTCSITSSGSGLCTCNSGYKKDSHTGQCLYAVSSSSIVGPAVGVAVAAILMISLVILLLIKRKTSRKSTAPINEPLEMDKIMPLINRRDIILGAEIGHGEFGVVNEAVINSTNMKVAVKTLKSSTDESKIAFQKEAHRLRDLRHSNIMRILGDCFESSPFMLILEYMENGDLKSYLRDSAKEDVTTPHCVKLCLDIASGFAYLQANRYIHRDLAARNVLLDSAFTAKIGDLGNARNVYASEYYTQTSASSWILPLRWMAPESYTDGTWDLKSDVWMFGVLVWEIFSHGKLPWSGLADSQVIQNIQRRAKLDQPVNCPNEFYYDLMLSCWRLDPHARVDGKGIVNIVTDYIAENDRNLNLSALIWQNTHGKHADTGNSMALGFDLRGDVAEATVSAKEVEASRVEIGLFLGEGAFGAVNKGAVSLGGNLVEVAIKSIKGSATSEMRRKFEDEARMFAMLSHPSIVTCVAVSLKSDQPLILLELMQGDLKTFLRRSVDLGYGRLHVGVVRQIASAMAYLESMRIVHRDIAARNVLVGTAGLATVKLNDFGLSRTLSTSDYYRKVSNDKVPIKWMAPECVIDRKYSTASDVWSFGVFCWEVFENGKTPYPDKSVNELLPLLLRGYRMPRPENCPDSLYDVLVQDLNHTLILT